MTAGTCPNCHNPDKSGLRCEICGSVGRWYPFEWVVFLLALVVGLALLLPSGLRAVRQRISVAEAAAGAAAAATATTAPQQTATANAEATQLVEDLTKPTVFSLAKVADTIDAIPSPVAQVAEEPLGLDRLAGQFLYTTRQVGANQLILIERGVATPVALTDEADETMTSLASVNWNFTGQTFTFSALVDGARDIFAGNLFGVTCRVTASAEPDSQPAWSPDNRTIAYLVGGDIRLTPFNCAAVQTGSQLNVDYDVITFDWSSQNVFALVTDANEAGDLLFYDYTSGDSHTLTVGRPVRRVQWNPAGDALAAVIDTQEGQALILIDFGRNRMTVETAYASETIDDVSWAEKGDAVLFTVAAEEFALFHYDWIDHALKPVAHLTDIGSHDWAFPGGSP